MPLMTGPDAFDTPAWRRFLAAAEAGQAPNAEQLLAASRGLMPAWIPGWQDVINIGPKVKPTPADWKAYGQCKKSGGTCTLDPAVQEAIQSRLEKLAAMKDSAVPGYMFGIGNIMNALDDAQDMLAALAFLGHLFVWLAPKIGARLIPGVGLIATVADLLNLLNLLGSLATPAYAAACQGTQAAIAAGIPVVLFNRALKKQLAQRLRKNPFALKAIKAAGARPPTAKSWLGFLLTAPQVTQQLFGQGIVLGGLYAALVEAAHKMVGMPPQQRGDSSPLNQLLGGPSNPGGLWGSHNRQLPPGIERFTDHYRSVIAASSPAERELTWLAARTMHQAPTILSAARYLDDDTVNGTLACLLGAIPRVTRFLDQVEHDDLVEELTGGPWAPLGDLRPATREMLMEAEVPVDGPLRWPLAGAPATLGGAEYFDRMGAAVTAATGKFFMDRRNTLPGTFIGAVITQASDYAWNMITHDPEFFTVEYSTDAKFAMSIAEAGRLPLISSPPERLWRFWQLCKARLEQNGGKHLVEHELDQIAKDAGIPLLRTLPPDYDWPDEWDTDTATT